MAGKTNEKPKQAKEATKGSATAKGTNNTAEQNQKKALHVNGKEITNNGTSEDICTIGLEDMGKFSLTVFETTASLIAEEGFTVRQDGEDIPPCGENLIAVTFKQGQSIAVVTTDGRKFILNNGAVNEA